MKAHRGVIPLHFITEISWKQKKVGNFITEKSWKSANWYLCLFLTFFSCVQVKLYKYLILRTNAKLYFNSCSKKFSDGLSAHEKLNHIVNKGQNKNAYYRYCLILLWYKVIAYVVGVNNWKNLEKIIYTNNDRYFTLSDSHFRRVYETEQYVPFWLLEKLAKKQQKKLWMKFLMPASMIWSLLEESLTVKQMQNVLLETFRTEIATTLICKGKKKNMKNYVNILLFCNIWSYSLRAQCWWKGAILSNV